MPPVVINLRKAERQPRRRPLGRANAGRGQTGRLSDETVYGLAASALARTACARIFEAKGRAENSPLALAIRSVEDALDYAPRWASRPNGSLAAAGRGR